MSTFAVGDMCLIERRFSHVPENKPPQHRYTSVIVKVTPKRAYFSRNEWFALDDPRREVKPRYLDYVTIVAHALPRTSQPSSAEKK